jgi:putative transport protein
MEVIDWIIATAPELFLLLSMAIGTVLGRFRVLGFSIGTTACTLIVAVIIGQLGQLVIPPMFKATFFSLFVFTIGNRSGPEFLGSLSVRTLAPVAVARCIGFTGLLLVLGFALAFHLDPGTASGLAAGSLTHRR